MSEVKPVANMAICIGDGREGSGCGYRGGRSGETCPRCGGALLSASALAKAEETARAWEAEPLFRCAGTKTETLDGTDYDCDYEFAGEITCEECQVNGGSFDPRKPRYNDED